MAINRANGSVTGVNNKTSGGGNSITRITASTTFEVQPQTTEVDVLVVAVVAETRQANKVVAVVLEVLET